MQKRGQALVYIFISIALLAVLVYGFKSIFKLTAQQDSAELLNLKTSIQTNILQQSVKVRGSITNASFAIPHSVTEICFFDSSKDYSSLTNPKLTATFQGSTDNLFVFTDNGDFSYKLDNLELHTNPLCVSGNTVELSFSSAGKTTIVDADHTTSSCVSVLENGNPAQKIDIVFLGYGFSNADDYSAEVNRYINNIFLSFAPYDSNKERFNFFRIDDAKIECSINSYVDCNMYTVLQEASNCPHDYIFVLVDRSKVKDFLYPVRSSAFQNSIRVNTADKPFVLVHEFGHSFGDLADEYVDEQYYNQQNFDVDDVPNCDISPCTRWNNIADASCFQGCSLQQYFRPTKDSVMRTLASPSYGPVNERAILERLRNEAK